MHDQAEIFNSLPKPVRTTIFKFFQDPRDLNLKKFVCKDWREIISKLPEYQRIEHLRKEYKKCSHFRKEQAMISAVMAGDLFKVLALQQLGTNIHLQRPKDLGYGDSLLHVAVRAKQLHVIKYLLEAGIDSEAKNVENATALDVAKLYKHQEIVEFLVLQQCSDKKMLHKT